MYVSIIKSGILLVGCTVISLAHSNDLIAFGKACLIKEERLNKAKIRLDILSLNAERTQIKTNQSLNDLNRYQAEKAELETTMTDCAETTPNSAYCHQIRHRYNELTYLIQNAEADAIEENIDENESNTDYEITKANFNQRYEAFIALCRNSDAHYALIQNPAAYTAVCATNETKESITCSLF